MTSTIHHGAGIKCFREIKDMKQEALAEKMGEDWTQKKISLLEGKESIEPEILEQVAKALEIPVEAIKSFTREGVINIISNTFNSHDNSTLNGVNCYPTFNPLDKYVEAMEENKKLYERLLQSEREKVEMMKQLVDKR
jgi:transcriptional regulator with XRE-family HTH domain